MNNETKNHTELEEIPIIYHRYLDYPQIITLISKIKETLKLKP